MHILMIIGIFLGAWVFMNLLALAIWCQLVNARLRAEARCPDFVPETWSRNGGSRW